MIPSAMRGLPQWVLWRNEGNNGRLTKIPYTLHGKKASSTDPATWATYEDAAGVFEHSFDNYSGIGFVFTPTDQFVGIDLDGCRNPTTSDIAPWAMATMEPFRGKAYIEISPSETGVKIFALGKLPFTTGRKCTIAAPQICDKLPALEVYDHGRYFAVTGDELFPVIELVDCQVEIDALCLRAWPESPPPGADWQDDAAVTERARRYLLRLPPAISQSGGHNTTFHVACVLICGFGLDRATAMLLFSEWNQTCQPPWSDRELQHKLDGAEKQPGPRNYLRNARPDNWDRIGTPHYAEGPQKDPPPPPYEIRSRSLDVFLAANFCCDPLVDRVMVRGQSCVMGGRSKVLKTSIFCDLAISGITGSPFLGEFEIPQAFRCGFISGESGGFVLQETIRRIARDREIELHNQPLEISTELPKLCRQDHREALKRWITHHKLEVVGVDPLYLSLLDKEMAANAGNVYLMGTYLQPLSEIVDHTGCTLILLHHFRKSTAGNDRWGPPDLEDLSQSGVAEWARQWILLSRREAYEMNGKHLLWMQAGGSAGHGGQWHVDIDEGTPGPDYLGRKWQVEVESAAEGQTKSKEAKDEERKAKQEADLESGLAQVLAQVSLWPGGESERRICRGLVGISREKAFSFLSELVRRGEVETCPVTKSTGLNRTRTIEGYRLTSNRPEELFD